MKSPFMFEAEPFPAASVTAHRETDFEEPGERFLGDLWDSVTSARIEDRTAFTPQPAGIRPGASRMSKNFLPAAAKSPLPARTSERGWRHAI
jgi:hypothetical protein